MTITRVAIEVATVIKDSPCHHIFRCFPHMLIIASVVSSPPHLASELNFDLLIISLDNLLIISL